ncbi:MAG TPA: methyltransferase domain-containing protein [Solirubrobacteraceae bacterium]
MPTAVFLHSAGIAPGMRVLDLGTGLGHVAFLLSELVGRAGAVVGIDQAAAMLRVAEQRRIAAGIENVRFVEADAHTFRDGEGFDAVVGRLILFHLPDPVDVLRHHTTCLAEGGVMLMIDFDVGSVRSEPPVPLFNAARDWVVEAFRRAGANPMIGTQLGLLLRDAGLSNIETFGIQAYLTPDDAAGPALLSAVVSSLAPVIVASGIATEEELALDSLQARLTRELQTNCAVGLIPAVAGAWGRRPARNRRSGSRTIGDR